MSIKRALLAVSLMTAVSSAMAAAPQGGGFNPQKLFFGGGISQNDVPGSDEGTGFQFFAGYGFGEIAKNMNLDVEVGYMTTGDMDIRVGPFTFNEEAKGLWGTAVLRMTVNPQIELLGRAGLDIGDDDGLMFGIGAGFALNKQSKLRLEIVERDDVSSLQLNFVFQP